jgi:hypothetical protein
VVADRIRENDLLDVRADRFEQRRQLELGADEVIGLIGELGSQFFVVDDAGGIGTEYVGGCGDEVLPGYERSVIR